MPDGRLRRKAAAQRLQDVEIRRGGGRPASGPSLPSAIPPNLLAAERIDCSVRARPPVFGRQVWGRSRMSFRKVLFVAAVLALPTAVAVAQSADDVSYCNALSASVRTVNRGASPQGAVANAMSQCSANPAAGIPVLEKELVDAKG